jgi:hypothetical protein
MSLKEEKLRVMNDEGKEIEITLRTFNHKQRKDLNRLVSPKKVKPNNPTDYEIDSELCERFQEEYVKLAIKSPPECASYGFLDSLPDSEFVKLQTAAQKMNGDDKKSSSEDEKKSEGPSKEVPLQVSTQKSS